MTNQFQKRNNILDILTRLPFWFGGILETIFIMFILWENEQGYLIPIPFLVLFTILVFSSLHSGIKGGITSAIVISFFIIYSSIISFGPSTLTGGVFQVFLGILSFFSVGILIGSLKDTNFKLLAELENQNEKLSEIVQERTASIQNANAQLKMEIEERKKREEELQITNKFQGFIDEIEGLIIDDIDLFNFLDITVYKTMDVFEADYSKILELLTSQNNLLLLAGSGWENGLIGKELVDTGVHSQAGYTLISNEPVIVQNFNTEQRFQKPKLLERHNVMSGISLIIRVNNSPFGIIAIHYKQPRSFSSIEIKFLKVISLLIGTFIERKRSQEQLQKSEQTYRTIMRQASDGIVITDTKGKILLVNPKFSEILGYSTEELQTNNTSQLLYGKEMLDLQTIIANILENKNDVRELSFIDRSGEAKIVEINGKLTEENRIIMIIRDITEKRRSVLQLIESEQKYRTLMDDAVDGIFIADQKGNYLYANKAGLSMVAYSLSELKQMNFSDLLDIEDLSSTPVRLEELLKGEIIKSERILVRKDGRKFIAELHSKMLSDGRLQSIVRDLTPRIKAEKANQELQYQLYQSQKMEVIGQLAGGIAHDFNNYLTSILGFSKLISQKISSDPDLTGYIQEITKATLHSSTLIKQLLIFSRLQTVDPQTVNINSQINKLENILSHLLGESTKLSLNLEKNIKNIKIDSTQFDQILLNLAVNARDAMPRGGQVIIESSTIPAPTQLFSDKEVIDVVKLEFRDTGIGMSAETMEQIFEPFFTTKSAGTGLGLVTVKRIVEENNGAIKFSSELGKGSTFEFYFPIVKDEIPFIEENKNLTRISQKMENKTVLIIEDNAQIRRFLIKVLQEKGLTIFSAKDKFEALNMVATIPHIDLVVSDIILPDGSGVDAIDSILLEHPDIKVIFMTGYADLDLLKHKKYEYLLLEKPFELDVLFEKIAEII